MILGLAVGWTLEVFAGVPVATLLGVLLGMIAANFVPLGPACGPREP
ncbi:MAG TPA: hypothetical protein VF384_06990 [Planctomycetota bacterium]